MRIVEKKLRKIENNWKKIEKIWKKIGKKLKQIEKKGTKDKNKKWMREKYLKHFYASHLFSSFKQVPLSRLKDLRDVEPIPNQDWRYKVTTAYELQETPFLDITSLMLKENID